MAEPPVVEHDDQQVLIVKPKTQTQHVLRAGTVLRTLLQCKQRRKLVSSPRYNLIINPSVPTLANSCPLINSLKRFIQNEILPKQAELGLMLQSQNFLYRETIFSWNIQCAPFQYSTFKLLCIRCIYKEIVDVIQSI